MKKRNIIAILAALAVVLVVFAACGEKEPEGNEPSTIIGVDGQVYEEVTEIATEIVTEIVTEVVTEVVTNQQGEAVTNKEGKTEVLTEVISEIHSEVVTSVVTVTVPYEPTTTEKATDGKQEDTTASSESSSEGSSVESTTTYEDVTFPEGTLIEVEMGSDGKPKETLMQKLLKNVAEKEEFYLNATFVTGEILVFETGMPIKMYVKGNDSALDMTLGPLSIRMLISDNEMYMVFPKAKVFVELGEFDDSKAPSSSTTSANDLWDIISPENMNYKSTSKVTVKGISYTCEEYGDSTNSNKYYFNSKNELKRIEIISPDGQTVIIKVAECSSNVDSKIFSVKGYDPITKEQADTMLKGMAGSLGGMM